MVNPSSSPVSKIKRRYSTSRDQLNRGCDSGRECSSGSVWRKTRRRLDSLRYRGKQIQPQNLPTTSAAARYHTLRVFLQVKQWQCLGEGMLFEDWGWKISGNQAIPVTTDLQVAPESLLKMIRCNCAADCAPARCSCRKHGLDCSPACGRCRRTACTNISAVLGDSDDEGISSWNSRLEGKCC